MTLTKDEYERSEEDRLAEENQPPWAKAAQKRKEWDEYDLRYPVREPSPE